MIKLKTNKTIYVFQEFWNHSSNDFYIATRDLNRIMMQNKSFPIYFRRGRVQGIIIFGFSGFAASPHQVTSKVLKSFFMKIQIIWEKIYYITFINLVESPIEKIIIWRFWTYNSDLKFRPARKWYLERNWKNKTMHIGRICFFFI